MAKQMKLGRSREKRNTNPAVVRTRRAGTPVRDLRVPGEDDEYQGDPRPYIDVEISDEGALVTDPDTIPRGV